MQPSVTEEVYREENAYRCEGAQECEAAQECVPCWSVQASSTEITECKCVDVPGRVPSHSTAPGAISSNRTLHKSCSRCQPEDVGSSGIKFEDNGRGSLERNPWNRLYFFTAPRRLWWGTVCGSGARFPARPITAGRGVGGISLGGPGRWGDI